MRPRRWRMSMTIAVIVSLLIGLAAAGLGFWDRHKINTINGQIASINRTVPATNIVAPTTGQILSGLVSLDALPYGSPLKGVQFVATGGSSHNVVIANGIATIGGWARGGIAPIFPTARTTSRASATTLPGEVAKAPLFWSTSRILSELSERLVDLPGGAQMKRRRHSLVSMRISGPHSIDRRRPVSAVGWGPRTLCPPERRTLDDLTVVLRVQSGRGRTLTVSGRRPSTVCVSSGPPSPADTLSVAMTGSRPVSMAGA